MNQGTGTVYFREIQRFTQWWLWALLLFVVAIFTVVLYVLVLDEPAIADTTVTQGIVWLSWLIFGPGLLLFFLMMRLTTEIHHDHILLQFFPFTTRRLFFSDIKSYEIRTYSPIRDYGGWGIRYGKNGKAYNVSGNRGIYLSMHDGESILIGSQQVEQLLQALDARK